MNDVSMLVEAERADYIRLLEVLKLLTARRTLVYALQRAEGFPTQGIVEVFVEAIVEIV